MTVELEHQLLAPIENKCIRLPSALPKQPITESTTLTKISQNNK